MIIIIKDTPDLSTDAPKKIRAIENILVSHGECRHVVWMPVETVQHLIDQKRFGEYAQRILFELRSFVLESRGIENLFSFHIEVDFDNLNTLQTTHNKLTVGYNHLTNSMSLKKSILLAENLRDAEIFNIGAEAYLYESRIYRSYDISLESVAGGGNTTYDSFLQLEQSGAFFACIIDSDLKHPAGPIGSTAKRFSQTPQGYSGKRYLKILNCHEIENIIPFSIVNEATKGAIENGLIFRLKKVASDRAHPDHKFGLSIEDAIALDQKHGSDYWKEYYPHNAKGRKNWIVPPLGENLLSECLRLMSECSIEKLTEHISSELDSLWSQTSKDVASWGVAMKRAIH